MDPTVPGRPTDPAVPGGQAEPACPGRTMVPGDAAARCGPRRPTVPAGADDRADPAGVWAVAALNAPGADRGASGANKGAAGGVGEGVEGAAAGTPDWIDRAPGGCGAETRGTGANRFGSNRTGATTSVAGGARGLASDDWGGVPSSWARSSSWIAACRSSMSGEDSGSTVSAKACKACEVGGGRDAARRGRAAPPRTTTPTLMATARAWVLPGAVASSEEPVVNRLRGTTGSKAGGEAVILPRDPSQDLGDHSSRSFRLGVRLGSLARNPNTKIPMKKKTTE